MANRNILISWILILLIFNSCNIKLEPKEYIAWVNNVENGLIVVRTFDDLHLKGIYRPRNYQLLNELGPENFTKKNIAAETDVMKKMQYYELVISRDSVDFIKEQSRSSEDYFNNLYYFTFNFQQDISLIYPGIDTLPCMLYHFERSYSLSNSKTMLLVFEDKAGVGDRVIHIDSQVLPTGVVNLYFKESAIKKASTIEIEL